MSRKRLMRRSGASPISLTRYAGYSIAAAVVTIGLKAAAYYLTGSVGLLSDALESLVNLAAAVMALAMLSLAARPPDERHHYGHGKAEYFASGFEGLLILGAALGIAVAAWQRLQAPKPLTALDLGLAISALATVVNFGVARLLYTAARRHGSIALEADARHLMTDVWTSIGVLAGVGMVSVTGWLMLDPIVALLVAANILWSGSSLIFRSFDGLMGAQLPPEDQAKIERILEDHRRRGIDFHDLRTSQSGIHRFMTLHVLVPGNLTVQQGHDFLEEIERDLCGALANLTVITHLEPLEDPASFAHLPDAPCVAEPEDRQVVAAVERTGWVDEARTRAAKSRRNRSPNRAAAWLGGLLLIGGTAASLSRAEGWTVDAGLGVAMAGFVLVLLSWRRRKR